MEQRNYRIDNVELNWAKLDADKPVSPFGTSQWEVQIATTDSAVAEEWKKNHLNVKEKDGKFMVGLKKKAVKADGNPAQPVKVVDGKLQPLDSRTIGNGSTGNVILFQRPYEMQGRKGVSTMLTGVQVTGLVEYAPQGDFSVVEAKASDDDFEAPIF